MQDKEDLGDKFGTSICYQIWLGRVFCKGFMIYLEQFTLQLSIYGLRLWVFPDNGKVQFPWGYTANPTEAYLD